jgi:glycopeptide antibiotics resistance protein
MNRYLYNSYLQLFMRICFGLYLAVLVFIVFFTPNRYQNFKPEPAINFVPLYNTIKRLHRTPGEHFWPYWIEYVANLAGNILLFMPMGFLLKGVNSTKSTRHIVMIGMLASIGIELVQLVFRIGVCDIDDVLLNTLGTLCGVVVWNTLSFKVQG